MRQVGTLQNEKDARRFAAFLITQQIEASAEEDHSQWCIWVRDENRVDEARQLFEDFRVDPAAGRYQGVEREADQIIHQEMQKRLEAKKNVVEMRGKWGQPTARRAPLTLTLLVLSVLVTIVGDRGQQTRGIGATVNQTLAFCEISDYSLSKNSPLASVSRGHVWRVITPIFIHLSWMHLIFNMVMFYQFGAMIESRRSTLLMAAFILTIAVSSNLAQALFPAQFGGSPFFGGNVGSCLWVIWVRMDASPVQSSLRILALVDDRHHPGRLAVPLYERQDGPW